MSRDTVFGLFLFVVLLVCTSVYTYGLYVLINGAYHYFADDLMFNEDLYTSGYYIGMALFHGAAALVANHLRIK
jgi:hypothetical protein